MAGALALNGDGMTRTVASCFLTLSLSTLLGACIPNDGGAPVADLAPPQMDADAQTAE